MASRVESALHASFEGTASEIVFNVSTGIGEGTLTADEFLHHLQPRAREEDYVPDWRGFR